MDVRRVFRSFAYAGAGLTFVLRTQPNFLVHTAAAISALFLAAFLRLSAAEIALLCATIGMVMAAEAFNTAIEALGDAISQEYHSGIKIAKDVSAAAVLLTALSALGVGLALFGPRLLALLRPVGS